MSRAYQSYLRQMNESNNEGQTDGVFAYSSRNIEYAWNLHFLILKNYICVCLNIWMHTYAYSAQWDQWKLELQMVVSLVGVDTEPKSSKHSWLLIHLSSTYHVHFNMSLCLKTANTIIFSFEEIHRRTCSPCSQLEEFPVRSWDICVSVEWACKHLDLGYAFSVACWLTGQLY